MTKKESEQLKDAYETVFDENGNVKACGHAACLRLMNVMKKYSAANLGNLDTGFMEVETIKSEYNRLIG